MGYLQAKSIKIDKKNGKISGVFADSNWTDFEGKLIYNKCDDLYNFLHTIQDKKVALYYDLLCGNIHTNISSYKDLVLKFNYFEDFITEYKNIRQKDNIIDNELYNMFLKYEDRFNNYMQKNCLLKKKNTYLYVIKYYVGKTRTSYSMSYNKEKAIKFNDFMVKKDNFLMENFDIEYI